MVFKIVSIVFLFHIPMLFGLDIEFAPQTSIVISNCIVPMEGVNVPCDVDGEPNFVKVNSLKCFEQPGKSYCISCLERVPIDLTKTTDKRSKECKVYSFAGTKIDPEK